jgi:hypothetical protein
MNKPTKNSARANKIRECLAIVARASGSAAKVFTAIHRHIDFDGYCWLLSSTIQDETEINRPNTIFEALNELQAAGVLDRRMLISLINGRNAPNLFRIGGPIVSLPENARRNYVMADKPKPKPSRRKSKATKRDISKSVISRGGDITKNDRGVISKNDRGVISKNDIQKYYREVAAPIEAADAVAVGSFGGRDRGKQVLESVNSDHRHPPSEPTAKSDDDDSRARHNSPAAKATTKSAEPMELRKIKIESFKATALARIEAKYPNQFSRDYLYLAFAAFESRTDARINGAGFFVKCFENESNRRAEIATETNVGAGPEIIPDPNYIPPLTCAHCGRTEKFHNKTMHIKKHIDPRWKEHQFEGEQTDSRSQLIQ